MQLKVPGMGVEELQNILTTTHANRIALSNAIQTTQKTIAGAKARRRWARIFLPGRFTAALQRTIAEQEARLAQLQEELLHVVVDITIQFEPACEAQYQAVASAYHALLTTQKIWDITPVLLRTNQLTKSEALSTIKRVPVTWAFANSHLIQCTRAAFCGTNRHGDQLFIYPSFVIITAGQQLHVLGIHDIQLSLSEQLFAEKGPLPADATEIDYTWARMNRNGSPDRRFAHNYRVPVVRYAEVEIIASSGLHELYAFSNYDKCAGFVQAFTRYQQWLKKAGS